MKKTKSSEKCSEVDGEWALAIFKKYKREKPRVLQLTATSGYFHVPKNLPLFVCYLFVLLCIFLIDQVFAGRRNSPLARYYSLT